MKNLYFLAAVAAFVLGSCTVEEALDPPAGPDDEASAIGFDTFLDRVPQNGIKPLASVTAINFLKLKNVGFQVEAYTSGTTSWNDWTDGARTATPNFMKAKLVTWSGVATSSIGTWTYSPIEYWQVSNSNWDKVSFFAYIPSISGSLDVTFVPAKAADVNENPKLYCTIPPGLTPGQVDLVVDAEYNVTHDTDNGKVKFKFDHVLSRIEFKAQLKNDYAPATVTMSSLTFYYNGLKRSGTYEFNSGNGNGDDKNNKAGKWEVTNGRQGGNTENLLAFSTVTATLNSTKPLDIPPGSARYLMLIPQENAFEQAYVTVSYTIDYPPGHDPPTETVNEKAYLPPTTWEPGIAYSYTLNIAALKEMIFDVNKVEDWSNWKDNPIPIDIPDTPP